MKKLIITCVLLGAASMVSFAQTTEQPATQPHRGNLPISAEQMAQRRTKIDEQQYKLTPEQSKSVYEVELEYTNALEKYRAAGQQPNIGQQGNLSARKDMTPKAILTPEQYAKYDAARNKERMQPMTPATQPQAK